MTKASTRDPGGEGGEPFDIDELARKLSAEAERLRREQGGASSSYLAGEDDIVSPDLDERASSAASASSSGGGQGGTGSSDRGTFGFEASSFPDQAAPLGSKLDEAEVLASVGDGGFCSSEFELYQELGRISVQRVETDAEASAAVGGLPLRTSSTQAAVVAFLARYISGRPYEGPAPAFLKEFLPGAKALALNELTIYSKLTGPLPEAKWPAAVANLDQDLPVMPLLGYFCAGSSDAALPEGAADGQGEETLWLVFKWDSMQPLSSYPTAAQSGADRPPPLLPWITRTDPFVAAKRMLRQIAACVLRCLAYAHTRGVVHGSIGPSSFLMSTFDNSGSKDLHLVLADWGFARYVSRPAAAAAAGAASGSQPGPAGSPTLYPNPMPLSSEDDPLALGQKEDLQAAALALLEVMSCALAQDGPDGPAASGMSGPALQRLFGEVFGWDVRQLREHVVEEPGLEQLVEMMDDGEGAGWELLRLMVSGTPAEQLLAHPFVAADVRSRW